MPIIGGAVLPGAGGGAGPDKPLNVLPATEPVTELAMLSCPGELL